jgi:hypothetical protein
MDLQKNERRKTAEIDMVTWKKLAYALNVKKRTNLFPKLDTLPVDNSEKSEKEKRERSPDDASR